VIEKHLEEANWMVFLSLSSLIMRIQEGALVATLTVISWFFFVGGEDHQWR
jgi:hypothetical protein